MLPTLHIDILQSQSTSLGPIYDEVVFNLYVHGPIMKHCIFRELNSNLIIKINHSGTHVKTK